MNETNNKPTRSTRTIPKGSGTRFLFLGGLHFVHLLRVVGLCVFLPYFLIGFILYIFLFVDAKIRENDVPEWNDQVNAFYSVLGAMYYVLTGSCLWAMIWIPYWIARKDKLKFKKGPKSKLLKNPIKFHREWRDKFYQ